MKKQKSLTIDIGGQSVDVGIPAELLADLGGMVYFGALARHAMYDDNDEAMIYSGATMVEFARRVLRKVDGLRSTDVESYMAWVTVLDRVSDALDIMDLAPESQSSALSQMTTELKTGGTS